MKRLQQVLAGGLLAVVVGASGCASVDPALVLGLYDVEVTREGRTDPLSMLVARGSGEALIMQFTDGITTEPGSDNATGVRAQFEDYGLTLPSQRVNVLHSSGELSGMLKGQGRLDGNVQISLELMPDNLAGVTSVTYELTGKRR